MAEDAVAESHGVLARVGGFDEAIREIEGGSQMACETYRRVGKTRLMVGRRVVHNVRIAEVLTVSFVEELSSRKRVLVQFHNLPFEVL